MWPRRAYWRYLALDYLRLILDDRWRWCRRCRRPVEHEMASSAGGDPGRKMPVCLDCGTADQDTVTLNGDNGSRDGSPSG